MILLFLIIFIFISFIQAFSFNRAKRKNAFSKQAMFVCSALVLLSFVVFLFKYNNVNYLPPVNLVFALFFGPLTMFFLQVDKTVLFKHLSFSIRIVLVLFAVYFLFIVSLNEQLYIYLKVVEGLIVCSYLIYASYGYLRHLHSKGLDQDLYLISYIILLFAFSFVYSKLMFIDNSPILDLDYIFMAFSGLVILICLIREIRMLKFSYLLKDRITVNVEPVVITDVVHKNIGRDEVVQDIDNSLVVSGLLYDKVIKNRLFLNEDITLELVADLINIQEKELRKYFKQSEARSFKRYINRIRVEHAVNIIHEKKKNVTIEELSGLSGFSSRLAFYRAFTQVYDFPPSKLLQGD